MAALFVAAIFVFLGLREGLARRTRIGLVLGLAGAAVIAAGMLVTTAGERGKQVTRALVDAVVSKDLVGGLALFSADATMNAGRPLNPGYGHDFIQSRFADLAATHTIESNRITSLDAATVSSDVAEVRLACITTVEKFPYPNASQWILRVERMTDGQWKVTRLTCVSINGNAPPLERMW